MKLSYNGLWKILIDKKMNKTDLKDMFGLSPSTISKMAKGENVSLDIIKKQLLNSMLILETLFLQIGNEDVEYEIK